MMIDFTALAEVTQQHNPTIATGTRSYAFVQWTAISHLLLCMPLARYNSMWMDVH